MSLLFGACDSQKKITYNANSLQEAYAAKRLEQALSLHKSFGDCQIALIKDSLALKPEAYQLDVNGKQITIKGGGGNGLIYGALDLIEDMTNGKSPSEIQNHGEDATYDFRAIKFDLPWDTYRHSYSLDQHYEICKDLKYWEKFMDMMVENRFNALTLWNLHPYTFMIKPKNYPEASPFSDSELAEWQALYKGIFAMAEERGIDTYIMPFNIFVSKEFSLAHNVAMDNLDHNHISHSIADTSALVIKYTRECIAQMLQEYPTLDGMGITHGEVMGGMTPAQREDWLTATIIDGMRLSGRKCKLIHRIPLSANKESGGSTSIEAEKITRANIEKEANYDFIIQPIRADMKYNWSHAHSTPKLYKVHGGKLFDTFFKPVPESYKVTWTARNEDFFCLRWGVPDFVRAHINENNQAYAGGYFIGSETYIPALDYFTKDKTGVSWTYAFERQWLFYKIWGRLLYNSKTKDEVFSNAFVQRFGPAGKNLLAAYAAAGQTPLKLGSTYDFTWDFTLYSEGFLARNPVSTSVEYISVDRQINQAVLDTNYLSIKDYVEFQINNKPIIDEKITPLEMAEDLEKSAKLALSLVEGIDVSKNATLKFEVADVKIWANLGLYFAEKTRGGVALQTYRQNKEKSAKAEAVKHLEQSLAYWDEVVKISSPLYKEMPLVHFSEQKNITQEEIEKMRFHWSLFRDEVAMDLEMAKKE